MPERNHMRWPALPGCPEEVDADDCLRGYRLILVILATLVLVAWLR